MHTYFNSAHMWAIIGEIWAEINGCSPRYVFEDWRIFAISQSEELDELKESIETVNQNRPPLKVINGYAILDHLGSGAFGSVFKVLPIILSYATIFSFWC